MQIWFCLFCGEAYPTYEELTNHLSQEHQEDMANHKQVIVAIVEGMQRLRELEELRDALVDECLQDFIAAQRN